MKLEIEAVEMVVKRILEEHLSCMARRRRCSDRDKKWFTTPGNTMARHALAVDYYLLQLFDLGCLIVLPSFAQFNDSLEFTSLRFTLCSCFEKSQFAYQF